MSKPYKIEVYFFHDLDNADLFQDTFNSFSYGDAHLTAVRRNVIIEELKTHDDMEPLISEIEGLKANKDGEVLIAF